MVCSGSPLAAACIQTFSKNGFKYFYKKGLCCGSAMNDEPHFNSRGQQQQQQQLLLLLFDSCCCCCLTAAAAVSAAAAAAAAD
jgi:hypothetical protein